VFIEYGLPRTKAPEEPRTIINHSSVLRDSYGVCEPINLFTINTELLPELRVYRIWSPPHKGSRGVTPRTIINHSSVLRDSYGVCEFIDIYSINTELLAELSSKTLSGSP
jgi:hypothetical protein